MVTDPCGIRHAPIPEPGGIEVRDPDDEIVAHGAFVHVERMDRDAVWVGILTPNGQHIHVWFRALRKGRLRMAVMDQGETPTDIPEPQR